MTDPTNTMVEESNMHAEPGIGAQHTGRVGNCMLLTLNSLRMLVPRNIVAEVVRYSFLRFTRDADSDLEYFDWRGRRVPHVKSAALCGDAEPEVNEDTKVAVFHGLRNRDLLPYYGFTISGSPRLLRVSEADITQLDTATMHPAEVMRVTIDQGEACIPKVDHIETTLLGVLKQNTDGNRK